MKRWAVLVVLLYAIWLLLLTTPLVLLCLKHGSEEVRDMVLHWSYWLWLAVMLAGQALLLLVPVAAAEGRPVRRRKILVPVVTASFFLANLAFAGLLALLCAFLKDGAFELLSLGARANEDQAFAVPAVARGMTAVGLSPRSGLFDLLFILALVGILWMIWAALFLRGSRNDDPDSLSRRAMRWLLRGSILELLVAVPTHVVVRHRDDCCAPYATFWGIVCGLTVMLMSFGPGVFFLFVERARRLKPPVDRKRTTPMVEEHG
ncbi:MAG TPA: hypothetical protein VFT34_11445 [Verrucomicrobiae bacterium]|nr:hypothetical protein [Verrucomicrobiae bacterium]